MRLRANDGACQRILRRRRIDKPQRFLPVVVDVQRHNRAKNFLAHQLVTGIFGFHQRRANEITQAVVAFAAAQHPRAECCSAARMYDVIDEYAPASITAPMKWRKSVRVAHFDRLDFGAQLVANFASRKDRGT